MPLFDDDDLMDLEGEDWMGEEDDVPIFLNNGIQFNVQPAAQPNVFFVGANGAVGGQINFRNIVLEDLNRVWGPPQVLGEFIAQPTVEEEDCSVVKDA